MNLLPWSSYLWRDMWIICCNSSFLIWMGSRCETKALCQGFIFLCFFLNFFCSCQTLVNADLPISCGLGSELSYSTSNWFGVLMWCTLWAPMVVHVFQWTFGTSFAKKPHIHYKLQNHHFSSTNFVTPNVKIHCHAKMHPCFKFEAIWTMFALDMVMIHHICLTCNEPSTLILIFVKRCVNHLL